MVSGRAGYPDNTSNQHAKWKGFQQYRWVLNKYIFLTGILIKLNRLIKLVMWCPRTREEHLIFKMDWNQSFSFGLGSA